MILVAVVSICKGLNDAGWFFCHFQGVDDATAVRDMFCHRYASRLTAKGGRDKTTTTKQTEQKQARAKERARANDVVSWAMCIIKERISCTIHSRPGAFRTISRV